MKIRLDEIGGKYAASSALFLLLSFAVLQIDWLGDIGFPAKVFLSILISGVTPGITLTIWLARKRSDITSLEILLAVIASNFSISMLMNLLCYALGVSSSFVVYMAFWVHLGACVYLFFWFRKHRTPENWLRSLNFEANWGQLFAWGVGATAISYVVVKTYFYGSNGINMEELIIIRKIAENKQVLYDNININYGDSLTYLVSPFYFLIAEVSILSRIDPAFTYSLFWAYSSFLGIICLSAFVGVVLNNSKAALYTILFISLTAAIMPLSLVNDLGIGIPIPNRYGVSAGILLPLAMSLFILACKGEKVSTISMFSILYVVLELTFVHAREAVYFLAFALCYFLVSVSIDGLRASATRIALNIIVYCAVVLIVFLLVHDHLSTGLEAYFLAMKESLLKQFYETWGSMRPSLFGEMGVSKVFVDTGNPSTSFYMGASNYQDIFLNVWANNDFSVRLLLPAAIIVAPFLAVFMRKKLVGVVILALSLFALFMLSPPLRLIISYMAGTSELLMAYAFPYILALPLVIQGFIKVEEFTARTLRKMIVDRVCLSIRWLPKGDQFMSVNGIQKLSSIFFLITGFTAICLVSAIVFTVDFSRPLFASLWSYNFSLVWHFMTIIVLWVSFVLPKNAIKVRKTNLIGRLLDGTLECHGRTAMVSLLILLGMIFVPIRSRDAANLFNNPITSFSGVFLDDYNQLKNTRKFESKLPVSLIEYLRSLEPGQRIFSEETYSILLSRAHYAPVLSFSNLELQISYILNWKFHDCFDKTAPRKVFDFLNDRLFYNRLIECIGDVDYFVTNMDIASEPTSWFSATFQTVWMQDGYAVIKLR